MATQNMSGGFIQELHKDRIKKDKIQRLPQALFFFLKIVFLVYSYHMKSLNF